MKIAMLCPQPVPPVIGGAERLWNGTVDAFRRLGGHDAALIAIPSPESSFVDLIHSYSLFDALDLSDYDMVVTGKYPAWMVRHERQVVHMCHTLRGLYDTYPRGWPTTPSPESVAGRSRVETLLRCAPGRSGDRWEVLAAARDFAATVPSSHPDHAFPGPLARAFVHWCDRDALDPRRVVRHTAISATVAGRAGYFPPGVQPEVIVPPSALDGWHIATPTNALFTASRFDGPKRIGLIIDAFRRTPGSLRLRIAGSGPLETELRQAAAGDERIEFLGRVSDDELLDEYASALAVPFIPYEEDLGLIAIEAHMSSRPVITCTDSGGTADLVLDGVDGWIVEPTCEALSNAFLTAAADPHRSTLMGAAGRRRAEQLTWQRVVDGLSAVDDRHALVARPRIVVLSTYPAEPARHGGQLRINRLYRSLAEQADVTVLAIGGPDDFTGAIAPGFWQTIVLASGEYHSLNHQLSTETGIPAGDIAASLAYRPDDPIAKALAAMPTPDAVLLSHPYLYPYVAPYIGKVPIAYDAHNHEGALKRAMYPETPVGRALANAVDEVERRAADSSSVIIAVSDNDAASFRAGATTLAEIVVVPNGSTVQSTPFVTGIERSERRRRYLRHLRADGVHVADDADVAVFVGSAHPPNIAAANDIMAVAERLPGTLFVLLGGHAQSLGGLPRSNNVLARGVVDPVELADILSLCTVALNPMHTGSGTNLKMADYFAAGAPVISTTVGTRGFGVEHGVHLLVADTIDALHSAVGDVIADRVGAERRAFAARTIAEEFDWVLLGQRLRGALQAAGLNLQPESA